MGYDGRNRRIRGIWVRNRVNYAQVRVGRSWCGRIVLEHANTVPEGVQEAQALKLKMRKGQFNSSRTRELQFLANR